MTPIGSKGRAQWATIEGQTQAELRVKAQWASQNRLQGYNGKYKGRQGAYRQFGTLLFSL